MNTNSIKSFAKQARLILRDGVAQRLKYWGFNENGSNDVSLEKTTGGYIFRGNVYTDTSVPEKWEKLKNKLTNKQAFQDIVEEAAYTWFNRLMAIKILEKRGYIEPTLVYAEGIRTPLIVQNAKHGNHQIKQAKHVELLNDYLSNDKEEQALGLLLTRLCNNYPLLHDVFGRIDDYTEILLPSNLLQKEGIVDLLNGDTISNEDYQEVELIGWLYQFYIADKKDEVFKGFKANKKARPEDIPAATQIFTPKWIVKYMVENTVGKIYLDYEKDSGLKAEMKYLVENVQLEGDESIQTETLIKSVEELTLIDPASGSGHILVVGFEWLFKMYREQGYTAKNAVVSILQHNLYGLEIDDRAMQLARFAVLLKAAEFYQDILKPLEHKKGILLPHIYSFPEEVHFSIEEIALFLGKENTLLVSEVNIAIQELSQGKNIGSALQISLSDKARNVLFIQYTSWFKKEQNGALDIEGVGVWNRIKAYIEVALALSKRYTAVVANPPYMGQKSMNAELKDYVNKKYPLTKSDLMTVFMEVIPNLTLDNFRFALINLPSWMFLSSFGKLREDYIHNYRFDSLLHMGRGIFGIDFGSVAFSMEKLKNNSSSGSYFRLHERNFQHIYYEDIEKLFLYSNSNIDYKYDFGIYRGEDGITIIPEEGSETGQRIFYPNIHQTNFSRIPGSPIAYWVSKKIIQLFNNVSLIERSIIKTGMHTGNNNLFLRNWYEVDVLKINFNAYPNRNNGNKWFPYNKGGGARKWFGYHEQLINWEAEGIDVHKYNNIPLSHNGAPVRAKKFQFREMVSWSFVSSTNFGVRYYPQGFMFDVGGSSLFSEDDKSKFFSGFLNSSVARLFLNYLNPTLNFQVGNISSLPLIENNKIQVDYFVSDNITISKNDWDSREVSWEFKQNPLLERTIKDLKTAYQDWQQNVTCDFLQLHANEEELNRIFINIYGLQDELTPEVTLKDITILQDEIKSADLESLEGDFRKNGRDAIELPLQRDVVISQFISYCIGLFLGRYRLDKPGLNIAHPNASEGETAAYMVKKFPEEFDFEIDEDAIIPLMGENCAFPDDVLRRIKDTIHKIWGEESLTDNLNFVNECLGMDLHKWLTEKFWTVHTRMYKKKPIYWLFTSSPNKPQNAAFKVLVYMHRMDKFTVQKIQRNYLFPHQEFIQGEIDKLEEHEGDLNRQEQKQLEEYRKWKVECHDYNEVLKELANKQIEFDLDDGVSVNYAKFEGAVAKI